VLALKSLEAIKQLGEGQATKLIIPADLASLGGVFAALKEVVADKPGEAK